MGKYIAKCHISHEGQAIQPGQEFELNPKENDIDRLIELNAIEPVEIEVKKASLKKKDENPGE